MDQPFPLIIIDDEPLAREAFSRMLESGFPEFLLTGEADSGPTGIELFRKQRPSIVVMDIRIPGFDGLEASRIILKEAPDTQIIVLSAFDDFRYVQEALHDGVLGYLLKPIQSENLRELLERAVQRIRTSEKWKRNRRDIRTFRNIAVREQVSSFLFGRKGGITAEDFAALTDPVIEHGYFMVFRINNESENASIELTEVNDRLDRLKVCRVGEWMGPYLPVFVVSDGSQGDSWRSEAEFLSREIRYLIRSATGLKVRGGIGPVRSGPENFGDSFRRAFDALQVDWEPSGSVFATESPCGADVRDTYPVGDEEAFLKACRGSNGPEAVDAAERLVDQLISPDESLMDARFMVTEFLIVFRREWEQISGEPKRRAMANLLREALLCPDHQVLRDWFLLVVRDLVQSLGEGEHGDDFILRKVKHFIDLNDLKNVSLESAADSIGITPSYLSRVFSERTGQHFHDYVLERRMESAARLLKETSTPVSQIAASVGYSDSAYFGRIFRKRYGSAPRDYRNGI